MKITKWVILSSFVVLGSTAVATSVQAAESKAYHSNGSVEFIPNTDPINPVDPENPDPEKPVTPIDPTDPEKPVNPGTDGPLSIDYASSLDFGVNKISNKNETYYARAQKFTNREDSANYVQISDNRGNNAGWTLTVKQNGDFKATSDTLNDTLTGAKISLSSPTVKSNAQNVQAPTATSLIELDPNGSEQVVMAAKANAGAGTWIDSFGKVEKVSETDKDGKQVESNVTKAVALEVPGSTPKDAVKYQTTLTWTLTDTPANAD